MTVIDIEGTAGLLRAKREALLDQLNAVDRALAELSAAGILVANAPQLLAAEPTIQTTSPIVPTRVTPRRVLSDEHRHALTEGRRKARHSKDVDAGRAREMVNPAPPSTAARLPRLIKRQTPD